MTKQISDFDHKAYLAERRQEWIDRGVEEITKALSKRRW